MAALDDSGPGDRNVLETTDTFGNSGLSCIKRFYEATTELSDLSEGVWLAALVHDTQSGSFLNVDHVRFEVPTWVRSSSACLGKEVIKRGGESERSKCDVLAKVRSKHGIESHRITFVQ